ncbi:hypothetical protein [Melghirimyces algeriensis]|nr:hypothetical protein [Melghirimyces algeriensis]
MEVVVAALLERPAGLPGVEQALAPSPGESAQALVLRIGCLVSYRY